MDDSTRQMCVACESSVPTIHPSICAGLLAAQAAVQPVEKDKQNSHHGYRYASAEAIIQEGRAALGKGGLSLLTAGWTLNTERFKYSEDGKEMEGERLFVIVSYKLCSAEASFSFSNSTPVIPDKGRPVDKATAAALSYDLAYTLRGLLLLPRVDEANEMDARNDNPRTAAAANPTPATTSEDPVSIDSLRKLANQYYTACKSQSKVKELIQAHCKCASITEAKAETLPALRDALLAAIKAGSNNG